MSLNCTQTKSLIDRNVKSNSVSYPDTEKIADINLAIDRFLSIAIPASGKWQLDDSSHTDYPIITTSLVAGQRDYSFVEDENGNLVLDIYKVMVADPSGVFKDVPSVDMQSDLDVSSFYDGQNKSGIPTRHDKTANGILLDLIPNYNSINGLKVFINREAIYLTTSDTTKKIGLDGRFHEYFALYPSYLYATRNGLANRETFKRDLYEMEEKIKMTYSGRERGVKKRMVANVENCK